MGKKLNKSLIYIWTLFLLIFGIGMGHAEASGSHSLQMTVPEYDTIVENLDSSQTYTMTYWLLPEDALYGDLEALSADLNAMTEADLDAAYPRMTAPISFEEGKLVVKNLSPGFYYGRIHLETEKFDYDASFLFYIYPNEPVTELGIKCIITPKNNGKVRLLKTDESGKPLKGAGFRLYAVDEDGVETEVPWVGEYIYDENGTTGVLYTDEKGQINVTELPYGDYYFQEVEAPKGYVLLTDKFFFSVVDDTLIEIVVKNKKDGGDFHFQKIGDDKGKSPLAGATFKLTTEVDGKDVVVEDENGPIILRSDEKGMFSVTGLPYGTYKLWETRAPAGYMLLKEGLTFEIDGSDGTKVIEIVNRKKPPIPIPKTGDLTLIGLLAFSVMVFSVGYKFSREEGK